MLKFIERFEMSSHSPCFCYFIYFEASEGLFSSTHCQAALLLLALLRPGICVVQKQ